MNFNIDLDEGNLFVISYDSLNFNGHDMIELYKLLYKKLVQTDKFIIVLNSDRPTELELESLRDHFDNKVIADDFMGKIKYVKKKMVVDMGVYDYNTTKSRWEQQNPDDEFPYQPGIINEVGENEIIIFNDLDFAISHARSLLS